MTDEGMKLLWEGERQKESNLSLSEWEKNKIYREDHYKTFSPNDPESCLYDDPSKWD